MVIWITGASSGIGEACAKRYAQNGETLILTASRADKLELVRQQCMELGAKNAAVLAFDLSQTNHIEQLTEQAMELFGRIDLLFCNAGISQRTTVQDTDMDMVRRIMELNFFSPVAMAKALLPHMLAQGGGQIAITTSIAGRFGFPLRSAYSSSKHALYGFFETLQAEYYDQNIRVTIVCPGRVRTNISLYALDKGGQMHGKLDAGQASGMSADQAANIIIRAIKNKRREVLVGRKELLMVYIKRFWPALAAKLARKIKPT